jgi:hypothetical protein
MMALASAARNDERNSANSASEVFAVVPHLDPIDAGEQLAGLRREIEEMRSTLEAIRVIQSPLVGIDQVAAYFGKSPDTIRRWVNDRVISCYKIPNSKGATLLFSMKRLEEDLEDYEQARY